MNPLLFLLGGLAYFLAVAGVIRLHGWWLDRRDAKAVAEFKAQCLLAEAERVGKCRDGEARV